MRFVVYSVLVLISIYPAHSGFAYGYQVPPYAGQPYMGQPMPPMAMPYSQQQPGMHAVPMMAVPIPNGARPGMPMGSCMPGCCQQTIRITQITTTCCPCPPRPRCVCHHRRCVPSCHRGMMRQSHRHFALFLGIGPIRFGLNLGSHRRVMY